MSFPHRTHQRSLTLQRNSRCRHIPCCHRRTFPLERQCMSHIQGHHSCQSHRSTLSSHHNPCTRCQGHRNPLFRMKRPRQPGRLAGLCQGSVESRTRRMKALDSRCSKRHRWQSSNHKGCSRSHHKSHY